MLILLLAMPFSYAAEYYVAQDGSGDFTSIQQAVNSVSGGDTIIVRDGTYTGYTSIDSTFSDWVTIKAENPYKTKLTNPSQGTVLYVRSVGSTKLIVDGFEMTSATSYSCNGRESNFLIHFESSQDIILRNNIIHGNNAPGACNELLKINRFDDVSYPKAIIEGNMFYDHVSAGGADMIDSVRPGELDIRDNIFFATNSPQAHSFITLKREVVAGSIGITPRSPRYNINRNIFFNYDGASDQAFIQLGEDGVSDPEMTDALIENNLMIGDSSKSMSAPIQLKGPRNVEIRANTIVGDYSGAGAYIARIGTEGDNPTVQDIFIENNILSDYSGSMGRLTMQYGSVSNVEFDNNLFHGGSGEGSNQVSGDPMLESTHNIALPTWDGNSFASGSTTIREEFERLVNLYGALGDGSAAIDAASTNMPSDDILGNPRDANPDIGCFEVQGSGPTCPDGNCDGSEDCNTCPADCGTCGPECGDGNCHATESCSTCEADCGICTVDCIHDADQPVCDGIIDTTELNDYINLWKSGQVQMTDLMTAIKLWKIS